jgi:putative membrane protein
MPNSLTPDERERIATAIEAAETGTSGEIYVVVAGQADDHHLVPVLWAAVLALFIPWPLHFFTALSLTTILIIQGVSFLLSASVLAHPSLRAATVPASIACDAARKAAHAQFFAHGVHLTRERTGVLIYVALAERCVQVVADDLIDAKVNQTDWKELTQHIIAAAKRDHLAEGLVQAIEGAGRLLGQHFPRKADDKNEVPNKVVEI